MVFESLLLLRSLPRQHNLNNVSNIHHYYLRQTTIKTSVPSKHQRVPTIAASALTCY